MAGNRSKQTEIGWLYLHKIFLIIQTGPKCDELLYYPKSQHIKSIKTKTVCPPITTIFWVACFRREPRIIFNLQFMVLPDVALWSWRVRYNCCWAGKMPHFPNLLRQDIPLIIYPASTAAFIRAGADEVERRMIL